MGYELLIANKRVLEKIAYVTITSILGNFLKNSQVQ